MDNFSKVDAVMRNIKMEQLASENCTKIEDFQGVNSFAEGSEFEDKPTEVKTEVFAEDGIYEFPSSSDLIPGNELGSDNDYEINFAPSSGVNNASQQQTEDTFTTETTAVNKDGLPANKKFKVEKTEVIEKCIDEAYTDLKQVAANPNVVKDEIDVFCELLGLKLRALDEESREEAMHDIDNLMFNIKKAKKQQPNIIFQQPRNF